MNESTAQHIEKHLFEIKESLAKIAQVLLEANILRSESDTLVRKILNLIPLTSMLDQLKDKVF